MAIRFNTKQLVNAFTLHSKTAIEQINKIGYFAAKRMKLIMGIAMNWLNDSSAIGFCSRRAAERIIYGNSGDYVHYSDSKVLTVFIHGWLHNETAFEKFDEDFENRCNFVRLDLTNTRQDIKQSAREVASKIKSILKTNKQLDEVNLVGHSMGGIVAATLTENFHSKSFVIKNVVAIGSPFEGTNLAPSKGLGKSASQMRVGSPYLRRLVAKMKNNQQVKYHFIGSKHDQVIDPWTSCFPFEGDYPHQKQFEGIGHNNLLYDQRVKKQVIKCLGNLEISPYA